MIESLFHCAQISQTNQENAGATLALVSLSPAVLDAQNQETWQGQPNGVVQLGNLPMSVAAKFEPGKKYKITITPVE